MNRSILQIGPCAFFILCPSTRNKEECTVRVWFDRESSSWILRVRHPLEDLDDSRVFRMASTSRRARNTDGRPVESFL